MRRVRAAGGPCTRLADRHQAWVLAVSGTTGEPTRARARAAVVHLERLVRDEHRVLVPDPSTRFAGDLSDATITRPR